MEVFFIQPSDVRWKPTNNSPGARCRALGWAWIPKINDKMLQTDVGGHALSIYVAYMCTESWICVIACIYACVRAFAYICYIHMYMHAHCGTMCCFLGVRLVVIPLQKFYICVMIFPNTYEANCPVVPSSSLWSFNLLQDVHLTSSNQLTISIFWVTKMLHPKKYPISEEFSAMGTNQESHPSHQSLTWPGRNRDALCRWCRDKDSNVYPSRVWGSHALSGASSRDGQIWMLYWWSLCCSLFGTGRAIPFKKKETLKTIPPSSFQWNRGLLF